MGSKSDQTSTQTSTPWEGQQPYLTDLFSQAQQLYGAGGPQYFPGQTVAPFSPQTQMGMDLTTQRALGGDPSMQGFGNYLSNTFNQQQMDPNQIAQYGVQGIGQGRDLLQQAGQGAIGLPGASQYAGGVTNPYTSALMGSSGYGGLGEASQFFGQGQGALPAATSFAQNMMQTPGGGAIDPAAAQQLGATAGGSYLGSNPYLDQMYDVAAGKVGKSFQEQIMPGIQGQFGAAGRTGSGMQALTSANAAGQAAEQLRGLAGDIYAPAYESERGRQVQAAGQLGQLGLGGGQLQLGAGGLAGDIFGQQGQRLGMAADMYGQQRGLGQQAMQQAGQLGLGGGQLASQLYGTGMQGMLGAGGSLGQLGVGGMGGLTDLYGQQGQQQFRAGSLAPSYQGMQYGDIQQLMNMGAMNEDQAQRLIQGDMDRWNFQQNAPAQNLGNYANTIYGLPGGYGTQTSTTPGGSRLGGAFGGAMAGSAMGPWGMLGGGILGALG
jgi:hypothetical protein